ncbi:transcription/translation regulatory transformer protein RfaH [Pseudomonas zhanjiangensis]|uniref:Transcription antitermination protein RfaH n=1 Tax=Pseudomonas zhanjiangensis TaxID=3239015 RepID=A0ABV3YS60_9PSED
MNASATQIRCREEQASAWYLVQCKPRQDERAEDNLLRQGYACYRPQHSRERILRGRRQTIAESLFPGYLFIQLAADGNWAPLRSTRGVSRVIGFGGMPLPVDDRLIKQLRQRAAAGIEQLFQAGDRVRITTGSFAELDAIFTAMDGEQRVVLLLNLLSRQQRISVPLASIKKID